MATVKIPLNKFRRVSYTITPTLSSIYEAPIERAAIIIQSQVSNNGNSDGTVSAYVSGQTGEYPIVENLPIPPNDSRSFLSGRLILQGIDGGNVETGGTIEPDILRVKGSGGNNLHLTLSILETKNSD